MSDQKYTSFPVAVRNTAVFSIAYPNGAAAPVTPTLAKEETAGADYQKWGPNNLRPTEIREKIQKSTTANPLAIKSACMMYGSGLVYYQLNRTADGITRDFSSIPAVDTFLSNNDIDTLLIERLMDYKFFNNMWCEYVTNGAVSEILTISHLEAEFSRFGKVDGNKITDIKYSSDWKNNQITPVEIPFADQKDKNVVDAMKKIAKSEKKFSTHSGLPTPGTTMYNEPVHGGLVREKGWLDYANSIPEIMNKINDSGFNLRYHIEIPTHYWNSIKADFEKLTKDEQNEIMNVEFDRLEDFLIKNGSSLFYSSFAIDPISGKEIPGWRITPISDPIKRDQFLTSVQEADIQAARAFMMDLSLAGIQPEGGKMGGGSGSDKRVGFENSISITHAEQLFIMEPLYVVKRFNNWPPNLRFAFEHEMATTLNENKDGQKTVA